MTLLQGIHLKNGYAFSTCWIFFFHFRILNLAWFSLQLLSQCCPFHVWFNPTADAGRNRPKNWAPLCRQRNRMWSLRIGDHKSVLKIHCFPCEKAKDCKRQGSRLVFTGISRKDKSWSVGNNEEGRWPSTTKQTLSLSSCHVTLTLKWVEPFSNKPMSEY